MLIHLLLLLLFYGVIFWAIYAILNLFALPAPFPQVIRIVLIVVAVILIIRLVEPILGDVSSNCRGLLC